jgi:hypothetical protein
VYREEDAYKKANFCYQTNADLFNKTKSVTKAYDQ